MAKRTRGSSSRPGQRSPLQRSTRPGTTSPASGSPASVPVTRPVTLTAEEEARAAELEAKILEEERAAETAQRRARDRDRRGTAENVAVRASAPLAISAADEYAYVARDVRRLTVVVVLLLAILVALWIVFQATGAAG
jgi:hypothetical protein